MAECTDCGLQRLFQNDRVPHGSLAVTRYDEITTDFFRYYKSDEKVSACRRPMFGSSCPIISLKACWPNHPQTSSRWQAVRSLWTWEAYLQTNAANLATEAECRAVRQLWLRPNVIAQLFHKHATGQALHPHLQAMRTAVLINCGAAEDVRQLLELEQRPYVRVVIVDSHRPICHTANLEDPADSVHVLLDEGEGSAKGDIPPYLGPGGEFSWKWVEVHGTSWQ